VIDQACALPVVADCDIGFGDADAFAHAVEEYSRVGIAAMCIEDQAFPKRNSLDERAEHRLASIDEFCDKLSAGKQARVSPEFVLVARVEAFIAGLGQDEAHRRAIAYAEAGADAILIHSRRSDAEEVAAFARRWDGTLPLVVVPTTYPDVPRAELEGLGIRMVIYANEALRAEVTAVDNALGRISQEGSAAGLQSGIAPVTAIFDLQE
jgi:phosphoenolpyruvate phosphomutase